MRVPIRVTAMVGAVALVVGVVALRVPGPAPAVAASPVGEPWAVGEGASGQLASPNVVRATPVPFPAGGRFGEMSAGASQTLAIGVDGELYAWGGGFGVVGDGLLTATSSPVRITLAPGVKPAKVAAGNSMSAAIGTDGSLWMWGCAQFGQLGNGTTPCPAPSPVRAFLPGGVTAVDVRVSYGNSFVLGADGHVYGAGANFHNEVGNGIPVLRQTTFARVAVPGDARIEAITYGAALGLDGTVYTWGPNNSGQLGTGSTAVWTDVRVAALPPGVKATAVESDGMHAIAIGTDGRVYTWGSNTHGQIGDGTKNDRWSPVPIDLPGGFRPASVGVGSAYAAVLGADGRVYAWGSNFYGNLGDGTTNDRLSPTLASALPSDRPVLAMHVAQSHLLVQFADGAAPPPTTTTTTTTSIPPSPTTTVPGPPPTTVPPSAPIGLHPLPPTRLVDTRAPGDGGPLDRLVERRIVVAGRNGVPLATSRAFVRITTTDATGYGELYVHPCGAFDPAGVVLHRVSAVTRQSSAIPVLAEGAFCVTSTAQTHLVVDVEGYDGAGGLPFVDVVDRNLATALRVPAGATVAVPIAGIGTVPAAARVASLVFDASTDGDGYLTAFACDRPRPSASTLVFDARQPQTVAAVIGMLSSGGSLCLAAFGTDVVLDVWLAGYWADGAVPSGAPLQLAYQPVASPGFVPVTPERLFDTRDSGRRVAGGTSYELDLAARLPATATDVVLNVTVTEPDAAGYLTVYPCEAERPTASNLNFIAGQTIPNLVTVSVGSDARVCLFASVALDVLADLAGWFELGGGAGLVARTPSRLFDTRDASAPVPAGGVHVLDVHGAVDADATSVVLNVTATEPDDAGFVTVYPCSAGRPTASNLNVVRDQTVPNLVTVALGPDRLVCFYTSVGAHLLADLAGWYAPSSSIGYVGIVPERSFDTRDGTAPVSPAAGARLSLGPGAQQGGDLVVAAVLNVTAVEPQAAGFVTVFPCAAGRPTASNVNFVGGQVVPNLAIVRVDDNDDVCFHASVATDLVVDLAGFFTAAPVLLPTAVT